MENILRCTAVLMSTLLIGCVASPEKLTRSIDAAQSRADVASAASANKMTIHDGKIVDSTDKSMIGKDAVVLSKEDLSLLDSRWEGSTRVTVKSSQVSPALQQYALRMLGVIVSAKLDKRANCFSYDLRAISKIELASLPDGVLEQAKSQLARPKYAERWLINACNHELRGLVIGADALPYISLAPEGP